MAWLDSEGGLVYGIVVRAWPIEIDSEETRPMVR